ncbi:MAG: YajQ family cyclic di-GMP-binding protein, partial [Thermoanaerobaculia bacterium]
MPSFDIVVRSDPQEADNAVNQARKELAQRYDFRGSKSRIDWDKKAEIELLSDDDFRLRALLDLVQGKLVRRGISLKNVEVASAEDAAGGMRRQRLTLRQGVPIDTAKEIVARLKRSKLKVQGQIQEEKVRVSGKSRDDLQAVIAMVREAEDLGLDFQF